MPPRRMYRWPIPLVPMLLAGSLLKAQPICSIALGPDPTICQGETVQLDGPPGFPTYFWSTGANTQSITVGSPGTYTCTVSYPTGNLAVNPNFSNGNTGFTSQFTYSLPLTTDGNYWIGSNAFLFHNQWQGVGNGPFLMVNAGWMHPGWSFWCQTVDVCPGQTYTFSFRAASLANQGSPLLTLFVNGDWLGVDFQLGNQGQWQQFSTTWTAPAGVTSAEFCMRVSSGHGIGNDFGFDDVSISATVVLSDQVQVNVTPLPAFDLGPNAALCAGESLLLDATVPNGSYLWQDGSTAPTYTVSGPGQYSVTVTADGCSDSDAITVAYNPLPVVDLGPDLSLCDGEVTSLNASTPGATYSWMDGSSGPTHGVNAPGLYGVTVTVNGCSAYDEVLVDYTPMPQPDLGPDQQICAGQSVLLDATEPTGADYLWSDGSTGPTLLATASGTYSVTVSIGNCAASDAMSLVVAPLPVVDLGPDQTVCPGVAVTLNAAVPGGTYAWNTGADTPTISVSSPGAYSVTVTANGCSATDVMVLANHPLPVFSLGADQTICAGQTATFSANVPNASYLWSTGDTGGSITTGTAGLYWLEATVNGCAWRDTVLLSVTPLPSFDLGPGFSLCPGATATLSAEVPGGTYSWSTGQATSGIQAGPGSYSVTVTANGCSATDNVTIGSHPAAQVDLGPDLVLCPGDQAVLSAAQPGASYLWSDGSTGPTYTAQGAGTVSVQLTDINGCTASDAVNVVVQAPAPVDLGPDLTICQGQQATLDATTPGATGYLWSTGEQTPAITAAAGGTYSVSVQQGSCAVSDQVQVTVSPLPAIDLGPDQTLCTGEQLTLDATLPGATYQWSTGAQTASIAVTQGGIYSVTLTSSAGCTFTDQIAIVEATPGAVELGPDQALCAGQTATLSAALPGAAYLWSTGAQTPSITVGSTGIYWVLAVQGQCSVSDTVAITVNPMPSVQLPPDQTLCDGASITLDAAWPGATYLWSTGATSPTITVAGPGTYSVTVDLNGCMASDDVTLEYYTPQPFDLGPDLSLCAGETATFSPGIAGASYLWSTGSSAPAITVGTTGAYWVQVTQSACVAADTVQVVVVDPGAIDLGGPFTACEGDAVTLDATLPNASYAWSTGATTAAIAVTSSGTYSVTATVGACSASAQASVTFNPLPVVDLGPDQSICPGTAASFTAAAPGATYLWHDGSTAATFTTSAPGPVSVTVTVQGCSASDAAQVIALPAPVADLGSDTTLCAGAILTLSAQQPGATYVWSTGSTAPSIDLSSAGTYSVTVDLNGCTASDAITVAVFDPAALDLGADRLLCPGQSTVLSSNLMGQHLWSTGATGTAITVAQAGHYWVRVTSAACTASDTVELTVVPLPTPELGGPYTICAGDSLVLRVQPGGAQASWSNGAAGDSIVVRASGTYTVTLALQGCSATDAAQVSLLPRITELSLGTDSTYCPGAPLRLSTGLPQAQHVWSTGSTAPWIDVMTPGVYTVQATGPCIDATGRIAVSEGVCGPLVHVPNAVTPNGDGTNDVFQVSYFGPLRDFTLDIFDRWGERIATLEHPDQAWDCTRGGAPVPDGVYVWKLRYRARAEDGAKAQELIGHVTVLH